MQCLVDMSEVAKAPAEVRNWFMGYLITEDDEKQPAPTEPKKESKPKKETKKEAPKAEEVDDIDILGDSAPPITRDLVKEHANKLIIGGKKAEVIAVLKEMGCKSLTDVPDAKLADLHAKLAVV